MRGLQAWLGEHLELVLTLVGVLVAVALTLAGLDLGRERQAFIFLVWLQGFILWALRRHAILGRRQLMKRLRLMLQDRINNQLTVMLATADLARQSTTARASSSSALGLPDDGVDRAAAAAQLVASELAQLSVESLRSWEARYGSAGHLPLPETPLAAPQPAASK